MRDVNDLRRLSLIDLSVVRKQGRVNFERLIKSAFPGRFSARIRRRFLNATVTPHEKEISMQKEFLEIIQTDLSNSENDIKLEQEFIDKRQKERDVIYEEFLRVKAKLDKMDKVLESTKVVMKDLELKNETLKNELAVQQEVLKMQDVRALVHRSAKLKQIDSVKDCLIVVTSLDTQYFPNPDEVIEIRKRELVEKIPATVIRASGPDSIDYKDSVIQYAELVLREYVNCSSPSEFRLVYSDLLVRDVLLENGFPAELL